MPPEFKNLKKRDVERLERKIDREEYRTKESDADVGDDEML